MSKNNLKSKINSKALTALIMEEAHKMGPKTFANQAYNLVFENPEKLTEEWVSRINSWAKNVMKDVAVDVESLSGPYPDGHMFKKLGPLTIQKKIRRNKPKNKFSRGTGIPSDRIYGESFESFMDYIAVDDSGWKYWFRLYRRNKDLQSGRVSFPKKKDKIIIHGSRAKESKTGITFLTIPVTVVVIVED